jgi:hypothetical protein
VRGVMVLAFWTTTAPRAGPQTGARRSRDAPSLILPPAACEGQVHAYRAPSAQSPNAAPLSPCQPPKLSSLAPRARARVPFSVAHHHKQAMRSLSHATSSSSSCCNTSSTIPGAWRRPAGTSLAPITISSSTSRRRSRRAPQLVAAATDDGSDSNSPPPPPTPTTILGDPVATVQWGGTLPSRRRFVLGTLAGTAVALGGNLGGITSALLSSSPSTSDAARRARLDIVFPIQGQLRCVDEEKRFEFAYPRTWMGDVTISRRRAERQERERTLAMEARMSAEQGLPPLRQKVAAPRRAAAGGGPPSSVEPAAAFGPPGSTGEENVSVVVAPIEPGFSLEQLGEPADAARRFLEQTVAPPGSGREAQLFAASSSRGRRLPGSSSSRGDPDVLYYTFEFGVRAAAFERRNVSVLAARGDVLYTLNAQAPAALWQRDGALLRRTAESFVLF